MKALNSQRVVRLRYPRDTPNISRKRVWMDRNEWRPQPATTGAYAQGLVDQQNYNARNTPDLSGTNYKDLPDLADRAARIGLNRG